jgi:hypothetical protein
VAKRKLIALLLKKVPTAAALGVNNVQKHCLGRSPLTYQRVLAVVVPTDLSYLCNLMQQNFYGIVGEYKIIPQLSSSPN